MKNEECVDFAVEIAVPFIQQHEGFRAKAYLCPAGVWTVGYGRTGVGVGPKTRATRAAELEWLKGRARTEAREIISALGNKVREPHLLAALVSLRFNIGAAAFARSTLLRELIHGRPGNAAEQFERWVYAAGLRMKGLVTRRREEKEMFLKGVRTLELQRENFDA